MKALKRACGLTLLCVGAVVVAYHVLLTDNAKKSLKNSFTSISDAYSFVHDSILDARGIDVDEGELPNQQATRLQWEALGF